MKMPQNRPSRLPQRMRRSCAQGTQGVVWLSRLCCFGSQGSYDREAMHSLLCLQGLHRLRPQSALKAEAPPWPTLLHPPVARNGRCQC